MRPLKYEPPHDKTNKVAVRPAKTQISLGIRPVWSESSLSAWRKLGSLATHWAHSEDTDQTGWMPRLIWAFTGCTATLLVLSRGGSYVISKVEICHVTEMTMMPSDGHYGLSARYASRIWCQGMHDVSLRNFSITTALRWEIQDHNGALVFLMWLGALVSEE